MKKEYRQPSVSIMLIEARQMLASSEVRVTVSDTEYSGEGRVKEEYSNPVDWNDIWQ